MDAQAPIIMIDDDDDNLNGNDPNVAPAPVVHLPSTPPILPTRGDDDDDTDDEGSKRVRVLCGCFPNCLREKIGDSNFCKSHGRVAS